MPDVVSETVLPSGVKLKFFDTGAVMRKPAPDENDVGPMMLSAETVEAIVDHNTDSDPNRGDDEEVPR